MARFWRWLSATWQFRCSDDRGEERAVRFPSWVRLIREGVPRPIRLTFGAISWRVIGVLVACCSIPIWGQLIGYRVWKAGYFDPWMEAARANPGGGGGVGQPPGITPLIVAQVISFVLMVGAFIAVTPACNRGIARRYVRRMLERLRCPWCSYDLSGAAPSEALTTCPECGGGWRIGR